MCIYSIEHGCFCPYAQKSDPCFPLPHRNYDKATSHKPTKAELQIENFVGPDPHALLYSFDRRMYAVGKDCQALLETFLGDCVKGAKT